jgi:hypothetical protein
LISRCLCSEYNSYPFSVVLDAPPRPYNEKNERQVEVYTNFFPIKFKKEDVEKMEVYQYHVKIVSKRREFCKDANGEYILDERKKKTFDLVTVEGSDLFIDKKGVKAEDGVSSDITRAVLLKCQKDLLRNEKKCIVCIYFLFLISNCRSKQA